MATPLPLYLVIADHIVDQAICLCLFGTHVMISFCVYLNHAERLTSICCQMLIQLSSGINDLICYDLDIRCLSLCSARWLMGHLENQMLMEYIR